MARSTLSLGMFAALAARIGVRRRGLEFGSPTPMRAAMLISRIIRVKTRPRFASVAPFLCLIVAHFECPDITHPHSFHVATALPRSSIEEFLRRRAVSENAGGNIAEPLRSAGQSPRKRRQSRDLQRIAKPPRTTVG